MSKNAPTQGDFPEFVRAYANFTRTLVDRINETNDDPDTVATVRILGPVAVEQAAQLSRAAEEMYEQLAPDEREIVERQLRLTAAMTLVRGMNESVAKAGANSKVSLALIAVIVEAIKKIIRLIFKLLGKPIPKWLDILLEIIDNILRILTQILGGRRISRYAFELETQTLVIRRLYEQVHAAEKEEPGDATPSGDK
jgi:hypothetical protein